MIKCYIVQNVKESNYGSFNKNRFYIAKLSSTATNTIAVLDNNKNWVPFKWYITDTEFNDKYCELYFDIWDVFYVKNKKELNEYVPTTKFYE